MKELYKRYRPRSFKTIVGNETSISTIEKMLLHKKLPHTILIHGPTGCGKTTVARIIKGLLECHDMDYKETNASSFRGIDTIRDVERLMRMTPIGPCRIWMFDECHKWTSDAQNASLKMLEDTPSYVYFLLCTTHPQYLLASIRNRCCTIELKSLTYKEIERLVKRVALKEGITLSDDTLDELVASAQGSPRMALVLLDKIANLTPDEQASAIAEKLGEETQGIDLCRALIDKKPWKALAGILKDLKADPEAIRWNVLGYARSVLLSGKANHQAYTIIKCFEKPFYDSKEAGLVGACFDAIFGE
jgi:DNA polymerase III gamma/tau subunit